MIKFLSSEQILENHNQLGKIIDEYFPNRKTEIHRMYDDLGDRVYMSPASSTNNAHNAFPGGYLDHVLRVIDFSKKLYVVWTKMGMNLDGFTLEELIFSAMHHDLGKLGFPGKDNEYYIPEDQQWRMKKGYDYQANNTIPWMSVPDMSIYILQHYGIKMSFNELHAIRVHDGLYDEMNKTYFLNWRSNGKFKTNLPYVLMHADIMAMRFEYQRFINGELIPNPAG